ncbi:MAG: ABC transporter permease [Nitrososphaeria archaeon]
MNRIQFFPRERISAPMSFAISLASIFSAFIISGIIFVFSNVDPILAYYDLFKSFTNTALLSEAVVRSIPIMLVALGLALAYKANFISVGGEGQIYVGGIVITFLVLWNAENRLLPGQLFMPFAIIIVFLFSSVWGIIPAFLKAKFETNEVLTTLMMNYIAQIISNYLVIGPWKDPKGYGFPHSPAFPEYARFPLIPGTTINLSIFIGILASIVIYIILARTKFGFEVKVVGDSYSAAKYAGISYTKVVCLVMAISAGLSGLAGMSLLSGVIGRLRPDFSPGYGYTGIIVAWLCNLNPFIIVVGSIFFGGLLVGGEVLQSSMGLSVGITDVFQALLLITTLSGEFFKRYRLVWRR